MNRNKLLVVVDMQNDFIDGALGSKDAEAIVDRVCDKIDNWDGHVCFTMDTHYEDYLDSIEGKHIPVEHCINETPGWQLNDRIAKHRSGKAFIVYKYIFGSTDLVDLVRDLEIDEVQLVGLCTDICVVSNAMLIRNSCLDTTVSVDASCCAGTTPENHRAALTVMKQCCIDVINDN